MTLKTAKTITIGELRAERATHLRTSKRWVGCRSRHTSQGVTRICKRPFGHQGDHRGTRLQWEDS